MGEPRLGGPVVTGISPKDGIPGTQVTLRGENLGTDPSDLVALVICDTDCLVTAKWKSPSKIVTRVGQAKRGLGDIIVVTKSGGRGTSNVQFRVFFEQVGPLAESSVWVDESCTVPVRSALQNMPETQTVKDLLGLPGKGISDHNSLEKLFPDSSGNLRMNNFSAAHYMLENYKTASLADITTGVGNLKKVIAQGKETSKDVHKSNLYSLVHCIQALDSLHQTIESDRESHGWPLTTVVAAKLNSARETSTKLFSDVLNRKDRADATRNALSVLTRFRFIFFLVETIDKNLSAGDFATILSDILRAKALFKDTEIGLFKEVMEQLDLKVEEFKKVVRERMMGIPTSLEEQSKLIKYLMILDPNSNPAWDCVTTYHCWLEDELWNLQTKYQKVDETQLSALGESCNLGYTQAFVAELLGTVCDKVASFWKLANFYMNTDSAPDGPENINQMVINIVNLASWLILNALMPGAVPIAVKEQYSNKFVDWPSSKDSEQFVEVLLLSLKSLSQFNKSHIQPLIELSTTLRVKGIEVLVNKSVEDIHTLASRENWKVDLAAHEVKTLLPDLYEARINEMMVPSQQLLTPEASEEDVFTKDNFRQLIVDRYLLVVSSIKDCIEQLLSLKSKRRPHRLNVVSDADSGSVGSGIEERGKPSQEMTSRKVLVALCNVDYVSQTLLPHICKRFADHGLKYSDLILERAKQLFVGLRMDLVSRYLDLKTGPLISLVDCLSYEHLPEEDDVSFYVKELIMGVVFIKSELHLILPKMTDQVLRSAVEVVLSHFLKTLRLVNTSSEEHATQVVIDVTAIEEALAPILSQKMRDNFAEVWSRYKSDVDSELLEMSLANFKSAMSLVVASLARFDSEDRESSQASDV